MDQTLQERLHLVLEQQRAAFRAEMAPSREVRLDRLERVRRMTAKHSEALVKAISADFGHRARQETLLADIFTVESGARHAQKHLRDWMRPRRQPTALHFLPASNRLMRQPLGVVGVVAPWNYPFYLALGPAVGALAAGNRVMIKPSELTPRTGELMAAMVAEFFAPEEMTVLNGDAELARAFTALPFDHLCFTGSTPVGRIVAQAAAQNLTPVTLELGGKSPALVDRSCDLKLTASRIAHGKLFNAGQTCVAPDYLLVPKDLVEPLVHEIKLAMRRLYPKLGGNPDYTHIATPRHLARLRGLLDDARAKGAKLIPSHEEKPGGRALVPHLLLGVNEQMTVMQEEIFGPLLPIVPYVEVDHALAYINRHDKPLALYWFGRDAAMREHVLSQTQAGGVTVNDCIWHLGQEEQPFGGVGASGMGAYHGEFGFRSFSKEKPVFHQSRWAGTRLFFPPYGKTFDRLLGLLKRIA
ncbi:coniferyl aldehyde dehydrogenase [Paucibacter sp. DJ2R-2]|uniref:coniferyl aldehyde dehydrogenase n=1 Tax=Paucibacter sp. DJ2R-2 TaxID=2893558 RepID=UPI0021E4C9C4|nr:coniferyl aldehyde dehydrogenase [Paucibacter sp. DJ2R-2]MCV2421775.1 coniferyl aldehyde dehydrogenase [Paucibacter sp. DJ4R-1]MCV2438480.1 coniferyl aldehyde dehydrogenase [Paucibacter sp. DJ2R-2]